jgi:hypothetical protein
LIKSCKHEPINELLGLIQWLNKEKTISKGRRPRALPVLAVPWSFKFIDKELQTLVHPSTAGPNPVASK